MIWIHPLLAEVDANVITEPLGIEHLQIAAFGKLAGAAVDNASVERDAVAGLHVPTQDLLVAQMVFDVGEGNSTIVAEIYPVAFITRQFAEINLSKLLRPSM